MKWKRCFETAAVMLFLLPTTIAFGAEVDITSDTVRILESVPGLSYPLKLDNQNSTIGGTTTGIFFSTGGSGAERGKGALIYETTLTWNRGSFHFLQEPSPNMLNPTITNSVLTIKNDGNVGIGNTAPGAKLDVTGWIRAKTGYGDSISIGGDSDGGDVEIQISAPPERNKISLWNSQLQSGVDLGVKTISAENMNITGSITTAPKTSYLSMPPQSFQTRYDCARHDYPPHINGTGVSTACFAIATVNLPHGAVITKLTSYWYYDANSATDSGVELWRGKFSEYNSETRIGFTGINGRVNKIRQVSDAAITDPVVDNQNYGYYVYLWINYVAEADAEFYGVVIEYQYTTP